MMIIPKITNPNISRDKLSQRNSFGTNSKFLFIYLFWWLLQIINILHGSHWDNIQFSRFYHYSICRLKIVFCASRPETSSGSGLYINSIFYNHENIWIRSFYIPTRCQRHPFVKIPFPWVLGGMGNTGWVRLRWIPNNNNLFKVLCHEILCGFAAKCSYKGKSNKGKSKNSSFFSI